MSKKNEPSPHPLDTTRRRLLFRRVGLAGLTALLAAGLLLAPALASQIGPTLTAVPFPWLAGALDALGTWWDSLGLGGQIAVGVGIAALIALSGGSLGLAFGVSGAATYLLDHSHGLASFSRDPATATPAATWPPPPHKAPSSTSAISP